MVFARDGRTLYFRSGTRPLRRADQPGRGGAAARQRRAQGAAAGAAGAAARAAATEPAASATARQVTYTANLEVDRKALRAQVFNEGWRIMKNRFYDAKMHGADWTAACKTVRAAARLPRRRRRAADAS